MTEEEKKTLSIIWNHIQENGIEQGIANGYYLDFLKRLGEKVEKLQKENEEMKKDLNNIIDLMYFNVISKQGEVYKPIKNLRKQDVYEIYYKIQEILETRCIRRKYIVSNAEE